MIKSVLQAFPGFTINDVLNTDYGKLIGTIEAKGPKEQKKKKMKPWIYSTLLSLSNGSNIE
ncbi:hypothetical protein [Paucilactobacillus hokkaidonensis]|uniref:hypothetical protein n=1 Tax=Paucilactobacillus hokkaidonensis TaxID=1193095 RepID=UPI0006D24A2B|nr:hypothetical protein [Paucilactobacillus hokkaidonensis]